MRRWSSCVDKDLEDVMGLVRRTKEENLEARSSIYCANSRNDLNAVPLEPAVCKRITDQRNKGQRETTSTLSVSFDVDLGHVGGSCSRSALKFIAWSFYQVRNWTRASGHFITAANLMSTAAD